MDAEQDLFNRFMEHLLYARQYKLCEWPYHEVKTDSPCLHGLAV